MTEKVNNDIPRCKDIWDLLKSGPVKNAMCSTRNDLGLSSNDFDFDVILKHVSEWFTDGIDWFLDKILRDDQNFELFMKNVRVEFEKIYVGLPAEIKERDWYKKMVEQQIQIFVAWFRALRYQYRDSRTRIDVNQNLHAILKQDQNASHETDVLDYQSFLLKEGFPSSDLENEFILECDMDYANSVMHKLWFLWVRTQMGWHYIDKTGKILKNNYDDVIIRVKKEVQFNGKTYYEVIGGKMWSHYIDFDQNALIKYPSNNTTILTEVTDEYKEIAWSKYKMASYKDFSGPEINIANSTDENQCFLKEDGEVFEIGSIVNAIEEIEDAPFYKLTRAVGGDIYLDDAGNPLVDDEKASLKYEGELECSTDDILLYKFIEWSWAILIFDFKNHRFLKDERGNEVHDVSEVLELEWDFWLKGDCFIRHSDGKELRTNQWESIQTIEENKHKKLIFKDRFGNIYKREDLVFWFSSKK